MLSLSFLLIICRRDLLDVLLELHLLLRLRQKPGYRRFLALALNLYAHMRVIVLNILAQHRLLNLLLTTSYLQRGQLLCILLASIDSL